MVRSLLVIGLAALPARAHSTPIAAPHIRVELVAEVASIQAGRDLMLGLRLEPEPGWHVYWRNPGDSGEAPSVAWTLPPGFVAGDIAWPAPTRIPLGPLVNFGYAGATLLPVPVRVPAALAGVSTLDVRAQAKWLVCNEEECIPGAALLVLALPVLATPPAPTSATPLFAAERRRLPEALPPEVQLEAALAPETLTLTVHGAPGPHDPPPLFFPYGRELIEAAAPQVMSLLDDGFRLELRRWRQATASPRSVDGVLTIGPRSYAITVPLGVAAGRLARGPLALAFLGGLLLNLMPCVFPVLAIKAFGLMSVAGEGRRQARGHGLAYTVGVLVSFWALAGALLAVRAGGAPVGWGFQLQSPVVVAVLAALFFWMALALLGVTTIGSSLVGVGNRLTVGGGYRAAFFTGVLATVVATPCSAPFMGTALGYALVQPPAVALGVFTALGLGLAFPYLAITFVPAVAARLPRPGRWMETLKELLAFPLLATVVWLTWVASLQGGPAAVVVVLTMLVLLGFAAWLTRQTTGRPSRVAATIVVVVAIGLATAIEPANDRRDNADAGWEPYSAARLAELLRQGRPVFVDFTAAWCVTCQVNERLVLATPAVRAKMEERGVVGVRADWTTPDPDITRALQQFGRDGVPLYVLYNGKAADPPRILPQILTSDLVISELDQLGRRSPT